jgi:hypothetical protein
MTILENATLERTEAFYEGMIEGVTLYAHWSDGCQYVGTCGRTLKEAVREIEKERDKICQSMTSNAANVVMKSKTN